MKTRIHGSKDLAAEFIPFPGYPFDARTVLGHLRSRLAREFGRHLTYQELGRLTGKSKSTAHYWFNLYRHPQLLGFMALLENLNQEQRACFIESHCRELPTIDHSDLPWPSDKLEALLGKKSGLSILTGGNARESSCALAALGHSYIRRSATNDLPTGFDPRPPTDLVQVQGLYYLKKEQDKKCLRELVLSLWPKILTSTRPLLLFNGLWGLVPDVRKDLLCLAERKHVVLAEQSLLDSASFEHHRTTPISVLRRK